VTARDRNADGDARWVVPDVVITRWIASQGPEAVKAWLAEARGMASSCAASWGLCIEEFLPGGSLSCVLACQRRDGSPAVLKLLAPWAHEAIGSEALALSAWSGFGVVTLRAQTSDGRALLMDRVIPGTSFVPSGDDVADCDLVAETLRAVGAAPVVGGLRPLSETVLARFDRARVSAANLDGRVSLRAISEAQRQALELARGASGRVAVHGDAQDKNLLVQRGAGVPLVAIDPEPAVGDPHFDSALWALTHRPGVGVPERCAVLAARLGLDEERLWSWCQVLAVAEVALDLPPRARAQRELLARAGVLLD
jgi:streptomycin 6-kinase